MRIIKLAAMLVLLYCQTAFAATPTISGVSGAITHGQSVTVSGANFGTKSAAAPAVWDDCSGTNITTLWTGGIPTTADSSYNLAYRTPTEVGRGISLPHSHVSKYMCGAHQYEDTFTGGNNVMPYLAFTVSFPMRVYASWYHRSDDNWEFASDYNLKVFDYSVAPGPYEAQNWYVCYAPGTPTSNVAGTDYAMLDDAGTSLEGSYYYWWTGATNPMAGAWSKIEVEALITNQSGAGYIKVWDNGNLKIDYTGRTDNYSGTSRIIGLEGYARNRSTNNWRYLNDMYVDTTSQRVIVCPGSTWPNRGNCEISPPTDWDGGSATVTFNQGALPDSSTAYVYVVNDLGENSAGHQVTIDSEATPTPTPTPTPTNATVSGVTMSGGSVR